MSSNADKFIEIFNRMEIYLKRELNKPNDKFADLVREGRKTNSIVRKNSEYLNSYRVLRNVIVHGNVGDGSIIADPRKETVKHFESIYNELINPPKIIPRFQLKVKTFDIKDSFLSILKEIKTHHYSQFPIYEGDKFKGLLSSNGITNTLAHNFIEEDGGIIIDDSTSIEELLSYEEIEDNYKFIPRHYNVYDVIEVFSESAQEGKNIDALLITHSGSNSENLLGIITAWDILEYTKNTN